MNYVSFMTVECIEDTVDSLVQLQSEVAKMEDVFRGLSKTFQQMVNLEISAEEVEEMMYNMKKEKEKLVIIRTIIPTKLNLYHNLATQLVSINESRKEILSWCSKASNFISQCTSSNKGNVKLFTEQFAQYKSISSNLVKITTQYQSVNKVCDTILNNLKCNEGIDTSPLTTSLTDLKNTFEATTNELEKIESTIQERIIAWNNYNTSKQTLELKISEFKKLIQLSNIKNAQIIESSEQYKEIENCLEIHQTHYMSLQGFLTQNDKDELYQEFNSIENDWQNIQQNQDISNIKSIFDQANR